MNNYDNRNSNRNSNKISDKKIFDKKIKNRDICNKNISGTKKSVYLTAVILLMLFSVSGCGNTFGKGTVIIADSGENAGISGVYNDGSENNSGNSGVYDNDSSKESEVSNEQGYYDNNGEDKSDLAKNDSTNADMDKILVYVCGHVMTPGVYELDPNDRIFDAINKAGGILEDGRGEVLAQAMPVTDGMTVYVPGKNEEIEEIPIRDAFITDYVSKTDSGYIYQNDEATSVHNDQDSLYNINKMTKEEWLTLPGIGDAKASAIIDYRKEHGQFKSIEELKEVPGIKEGVFNKIKDKIKV